MSDHQLLDHVKQAIFDSLNGSQIEVDLYNGTILDAKFGDDGVVAVEVDGQIKRFRIDLEQIEIVG